jgi:hypothetical protein
MWESLRTAAYQTESALRHHPIEEAFSKIKSILRKMGARTHEALLEAISEALSAITLGDVVGWFRSLRLPS